MKGIKKLLVLSLCIGGVIFGGVIVWATEIIGNGTPTGNTIEVSGEGVDASTDALNITTTPDSGVIHVKIENISSEEVKNLAVVYDNSNFLTAYKNIFHVDTLASGESIYYDLATIDLGSNTFKVIAESVGGFYYLLLLIPVIVLGFGITSSIIIVRMRMGKQKHNVLVTIVGLLVTALAMMGTLFYLQFNYDRSEYSLLDTGENYTRYFNVETLGGDSVSFSVKYNQDSITYKITEADEEIPFETTYEYDETLECTASSSIKSDGKPGKKHVVTTTVYRNGEKDSETSEETIITQPTDQVEIQGTKTVIETQNVEAYKEYIPDDNMYVGQFQLQTSSQEAKSHVGKKEVTWNWDKEKEELVSKEEVTKQPGTDTWKAGTLVKVEEVLKASINYVAAEDKELGYTNTVSTSKDGKRITLYKAEINPTTGLRMEDTELEFVNSDTTDPVNGKVEVGVMREEDITTPCQEKVTYDNTKWSYEETITSKGVDQIEHVVSVMKLDKTTGQVTDQVEREISREVIQESVPQEVIRGSKEPNWVEEKVITGEVEYSTVYVPDESLSGDEQRVVQKGEKGSLYTTRLIAVDDEGNPVQGYEPQIVEEDALSDSKDEVIHVAPDSPLLD